MHLRKFKIIILYVGLPHERGTSLAHESEEEWDIIKNSGFLQVGVFL